MRLAASIKLGYYPTPPEVTDYLKTRIDHIAVKTTCLDPCAGTGLALKEIAPANALTYGIEPEPERFRQASEFLDQTLNCALEDTTIAHNSFGLLLLNPPYDQHYDNDRDIMESDMWKQSHGKTIRKEIMFLRRTLPYLAPNGLLIFIVPEHILDQRLNEYLTARLSSFEAYRFPEELYPEFRQIIVIGNKRPEKPQPSSGLIELHAWTDRIHEPLSIPAASPVGLFRANRLSEEKVTELLTLHDGLRQDMYPSNRQALKESRPPLPLHIGHLSLMLAAGKINGVMAPGTPQRHVVRGAVNKRQSVSQTTEETENGTTTVTRVRDSYAITVKLLHPDGLLETLT